MAQDTLAQAEGSTESAASADSLNNPGKEQTLDERLNGVQSMADVRKLIEDAEGGKLRSSEPEEVKAPPSSEETVPADAQATDPAQAQSTEGDVMVGESPTEAKPEEPAAAASEEGDKSAGDADSEGKLPERIRLTNFSKVEKLALQLKRDDPKLTLAEAEARAKAALGVKDEPQSKEATESTLPQTVADLDAKIAELKAARTKARTEDLDFKEADRLDNEIDALREHRMTLRSKEAEKASEEQRAYNEAFDAAHKKAASLYDFVTQKDSAGFKRMAEIDRQLEENGDPLFNDPNKALKIAQMAAKELLIAPKSAKAVVAKPAAAPANSMATVKKGVPPVASGASRTATGSTQGARISEEIDAIRTPADMERFLKKLNVSAD